MGSHKTMLGSGAYDYRLWVFLSSFSLCYQGMGEVAILWWIFFSFDVLKLPVFSPSNATGLY